MSVFVLVAVAFLGLNPFTTVIGVYQSRESCMAVATRIFHGEDSSLSRPVCMSAELKP